jgi:hypothetical protein
MGTVTAYRFVRSESFRTVTWTYTEHTAGNLHNSAKLIACKAGLLEYCSQCTPLYMFWSLRYHILYVRMRGLGVMFSQSFPFKRIFNTDKQEALLLSAFFSSWWRSIGRENILCPVSIETLADKQAIRKETVSHSDTWSNDAREFLQESFDYMAHLAE